MQVARRAGSPPLLAYGIVVGKGLGLRAPRLRKHPWVHHAAEFLGAEPGIQGKSWQALCQGVGGAGRVMRGNFAWRGAAEVGAERGRQRCWWGTCVQAAVLPPPRAPGGKGDLVPAWPDALYLKRKKKKEGKQSIYSSSESVSFFFSSFLLFSFSLMHVSKRLCWPRACWEWQSLSSPDEWWAYVKHVDNVLLGSTLIETASSLFTANSLGNEKR